VLHEADPALVHGVISGYGQDGSRAAWPALDFVVQAHAGILSVTGPDAETNVKAGVPVADLSAGLYCAIGVLAAVHRARATGEGGRVEVSLAVTSELQFARLCRVAGLDALAADPRFATNAARVAHREALEALLETAFAARPAAAWVVALNAAGVAAGAIDTVAEVLADPDVAVGLVAALPDGTPQLRTPIRLGGAPLPLGSAPPRLGEHTDAVRAALRADGAT